MRNARSQAELVTLRKHAQDIAVARKERVTSVHLLAAIAASEGSAGELLRDRKLDEETLLKASRSFDDEGPDPIGRLLAAARQVATRAPSPEPGALHLLLALLADRARRDRGATALAARRPAPRRELDAAAEPLAEPLHAPAAAAE